MRSLSLLALVAVLFSGCSKKDIIKWTQKSRCDLAGQTTTWFYNGKPFIEKTFEQKTHYSSGLPKSLKVAFEGSMGEYDSLQYSFEYAVNTATVHAKSTRWPNNEGEIVNESYSFTVKFDPQTGYATQVGNDVVKYENKKVTWFGKHKLEYDTRGNLIRILANGSTDPDTEMGSKFKYDRSKKIRKPGILFYI